MPAGLNSEVSSADLRLDRNLECLERLLARTEAALDTNRLAEAALNAQLAATFAWFNHCGLFVSHRLEAALRRLSASLPGRLDSEAAITSKPASILHIATQVYPTGGHTQMIARWLELDRDREHRVCLTAQGPTEVAAKIADRLGRTDLRLLDRDNHDLLGRAAALRKEAMWADLIVLHVHPNDVVAPIALSGVRCPPTILVNHADHVFWVGVLTADVVMNLRNSGAELSIERRGVEPHRNLTYNRPLRLQDRTTTRDAARRAIGAPPSRTIIATAAAASKYEAIGPMGFVDLLLPSLRAHRESFLIAAGPSATGRWKELEDEGFGRALGEIPDVATLMQAADIYVDSFPFASLTSMLEAASFGVPVVSFKTQSAECAVLGADTPELDRVMFTPSNPAQFDDVMSALVTAPGYREKQGLRTFAEVQQAHGGDSWAQGLAGLYRAAAEAAALPPGVTERTARLTSDLDRQALALQAQTGHGAGELGAGAVHLGLMPFAMRIRNWLAVRRSGSAVRVTQLLSARQRMWFHSLRVPRNAASKEIAKDG